ncbi:VIT1/CCC1 transporter family protein [Candidatus Woesebacteria bacterium]|nr:VIT1/CCC1 transporter family protein [Candidatus Woesebacteria bacterium]
MAKKKSIYLRNFIFGVEDSLVSTVGLLAGVAAADISQSAIVTTGLVLIVVEGFSMGIGSFLTEETTEEMAGIRVRTLDSVKGAITMLVSYCLAGLLPLAPYTILSGDYAVNTSITVSLLGLMGLGYGTSLYYKRPYPIFRAFKMLLLGGSAVFVGMMIGKLFHL